MAGQFEIPNARDFAPPNPNAGGGPSNRDFVPPNASGVGHVNRSIARSIQRPDPTQPRDDFTVDPDFARDNPEEAQAQLTRSQFEFFEKNFLADEDAAIRFAGNRDLAEAKADEAGATIGDIVASSRGQTSRRLSRFGIQQSGRERAVDKRTRSLDEAAATGVAKNQTRRDVRDIQTAVAQDVLDVGKGISGQAGSALSSASGMAFARNQAHQQAKASRTANTISTVGSGAGIGFAVGGPIGAGIGAGAGLLLSNLF